MNHKIELLEALANDIETLTIIAKCCVKHEVPNEHIEDLISIIEFKIFELQLEVERIKNCDKGVEILRRLKGTENEEEAE